MKILLLFIVFKLTSCYPIHSAEDFYQHIQRSNLTNTKMPENSLEPKTSTRNYKSAYQENQVNSVTHPSTSDSTTKIQKNSNAEAKCNNAPKDEAGYHKFMGPIVKDWWAQFMSVLVGCFQRRAYRFASKHKGYFNSNL